MNKLLLASFLFTASLNCMAQEDIDDIEKSEKPKKEFEYTVEAQGGGDIVKFLVFDLKPPCHGTVDYCLQLGTDGVEVYRACQHNDIGIDHLLQDVCHIILVDAGSTVGAAVVAAGTGSHLFLSDPDLFCFVPGILCSTQKFIA